jgi:hypothetical protein
LRLPLRRIHAGKLLNVPLDSFGAFHLVAQAAVVGVKRLSLGCFGDAFLLPLRDRRQLLYVETLAQIPLGGVIKRDFGAVRFVIILCRVKRLLRLALREQTRLLSGSFVLSVQLFVMRLLSATILEVLALPDMLVERFQSALNLFQLLARVVKPVVHFDDFPGKPRHIADVVFLQEAIHLRRRFEVGDFSVMTLAFAIIENFGNNIGERRRRGVRRFGFQPVFYAVYPRPQLPNL